MAPTTPKKSWLQTVKARLGGEGQDFGRDHVDDVDRGHGDTSWFGAPTLTTASLLGAGTQQARNRQLVYEKYAQMVANPLVAGALRTHATAALGGHETSGDMVFIETSAKANKDAKAVALVAELNGDLAAIFNRIAMTVTFNAVAYGDAFGRLYPKKGVGVVDVICDEVMLPPLVQPFEQGQKTVVCQVAAGTKYIETLAMDQIARMKMPRMIYVPQTLAIEKAWRNRIKEDDIDKLPLMPALAGGSFLIDAEDQYDKFTAAMNGLVGQRVLDSIDESIITANVSGMTKEQRGTFLNSLKKVMEASKRIAEDAIKSGTMMLGRIRHMIPVYNEKQVMSMQGVNASGGSGAGRASSVSIEDVMFHAKLLGGALGIDITMLGFADLMSGGLGDGGFFRTSVQAAERSRTIRVALSDFYNHIADVHLAYKHGIKYPPGDRPWSINFYGSISALETERQRTTADAYNSGAVLAQVFEALKGSGLDEPALAHLMKTVLKMDEADAKMYAKALAKAKAVEANAAGGGGGFGGGPFGGGDEPPIAPGGAADGE